MIELQNVGFAYNNKHTVFSNLNLYIDRGDIVSIVGIAVAHFIGIKRFRIFSKSF